MQEYQFLEALRSGDESAFEQLIELYQASLVRVAMLYVPTRLLAEEAVQETWIGVLKGLHRFEGRSSLKTWIYSILMNQSKTIAQREVRIPVVALEEENEFEPAVPHDRFRTADADFPGHWIEMPASWDDVPEENLIHKETRRYVQQAIDGLAANQRLVITLRDVEMLTSEEVCNILGVSETNQRVLLHRARSKVREALERYFDEQ